MPSVQWSINSSVDFTTNETVTHSNNDWADKIASIPAYARIDSVQLDFRRSISGGSGNYTLKIGGNQILSGNVTTTSQVTSSSIKSYVNSETSSNVGQLSNNISINFKTSIVVRRFFYILTITWNYTPRYYLDVNGLINGQSAGKITEAGTFDVYINSAKVSTAVDDYYTRHDVGSKYEIKNIKPKTGWQYDGVHSGSLSGTLNAATNVVLAFSKIRCTISKGAMTGGTIGGIGTYDYGTEVTLTAIPNDGYTFSHWKDDITNKDPIRKITVTSNATYSAVFEIDKINNIYSGGTKANVYIGATEVSAVYVGGTKIYG